MRTDRFFITTPIEGSQALITDPDLLHQWRSVLRLVPGDTVVVCDNSGYEYTGTLETYDGGTAVVAIDSVSEKKAYRELTLFMALIKKDAFELVVQKATELGVTRIVPLVSDHTVKKNIRMDRLISISREASEQSERTTLPEIYEIHTLAEACAGAPDRTYALSAERSEQGTPPTGDIKGVFVGPEGGWSRREQDMFAEHHIPFLCLGRQVLRAETAAISICSHVLLAPFCRDYS